MAFSGEENFGFYGGYDDAERKILCFTPFCDYGEKEYPITKLKIYTKDKKVFSHRDYLGSILSLGIKREKIGDILILDTFAVCFCHAEIADFLIYNLKKIAHSNIFVEIFDENCYNFIKQFRQVHYTVASMRLDAVVSAFTKKSRAVSAELIKKGYVNVNYQVNENASHTVCDGDIISAKGFGKAIINTENALTKKGRTNITVKYYV
jgi:RNA-binding protein YlmH